MKRIFTLSGVCLLTLMAAIIIFNGKQPHHKPRPDSDEGTDNPLGLAQYMHMRYANPATGKMPFGGTYHAYEQLVARGLIKPGLIMSRSGSNTNIWQLVNDFFPSIAVTMITYDPQHPNVFYFCTGEGWDGLDMAVGAGIFKSTDAGNTWAQLSSTDTSIFDYCQDIKVHPTTGDVYVTTRNNGLMRSQDGGTTWHNVLGNGNYTRSTGLCNIAFTKTGGIFCTGAIFETGGIYYSNTGDSGAWTKQTNGFPIVGTYRVQIATAPSNDSVAYAVACNTSTYAIQGFYKTTNKGNTWTTLPNPGNNTEFAKIQAWYDLALAVDPNNDSIVAAGGWELWRSKNGGQTWMQLADGQPDSTTGQYVHVDQHEIVFIGSDTVLFGNDGGVWETYDFKDSLPYIFSRNYGYRVTQFYDADINRTAGSSFVFGGTQDNGSPAMPYTGISNYFDLSWADGAYCAINYNNPAIAYTTKNSNGIYRSNPNNNGSTRDTITNPYLTETDVLFVNPMEMDPNNPDILYMGSDDGLWRLTKASTAKDSDWTQASKSTGSSYTFISAIGISKSQPNTLFLGYNNQQTGSGGTVFRIVNADTTSKTCSPINCDPKVYLPTSAYLASIEVDPSNVNHVFAVYTNYGVKNIWESHNATADTPLWICDDGNLPDLPVNDVFMNPGDSNVCYAATDLGVFYTTQLNGSNTQWLPSNQGLANVRAEVFKYRPSDSTIIVATHGRGIFQSKLNVTNSGSYEITWNERGPYNVGGRTRTLMVDPNDPSHHRIWAGSVAGGIWYINNIDSLPPTTGINSLNASIQNGFSAYPNPFNSIVHFKFNSTINSENSVLKIFDITGRVVEQMNCGTQTQFTWQPSAGASPGLYFAELIAGNKKYIQKIIYLK